ncbi:protein FAR1-RELATED SEQUENCE 5-like [Neltuma alba]|uniref:protein FAR1-RELATED SEQUENCE 5-like n=1 Tax=Neltuma alba TaxID=207710 RepID=UPI0010A439B1|nr:protein FAR1-RELATED SEQUENCE 5-like [Prosopis alba]
MEDELKPKIGKEFGSWEEAWTFWQDYGKRIGFGPRKYNGTKSRKDGSLITYRYVCSKEGVRKEGKQETYSSKFRAETRTKCKAKMIVSIVDGKYKVTKFNEEHNHPLHTPETIHLLASQRNLAEVDAYGIDLARKSGLQQKATFDLMSTYAGGKANLGYTRVDLQNYLQSKKQRSMKYGEVRCLFEYFQKQLAANPAFYHKYQVDTEEEITNVFWADAGMLIDYALFGEVVSLDTTYCTNRDHRPLAIFSGFNHYRSTVIFGAALLYDETTVSFKWLLETFLEAHMQKKPKTVFTDQDQAMTRALSEVLPHTKHCLCTWHLKQNGIKHLGNLMKDGSHFLSDFCKCMSKISEEEKFEEAWSQLISSYDVKNNPWLISMYNIKEKWAWCYVKNACTLGMRSTQLSESVNADVKKCTTPSLSINDFFTTFDKVVSEKRDKELKLEFDSRQQIPRMVNQSAPILRQLVLTYTPSAFRMFQVQWDLQFSVMLTHRDEKEPLYIYIAHMINEEGEWRVKFKPDTHDIFCTCGMFETTGILCCHILKVYESKDVRIMPEKYIMKRWTRKARSDVVYDLRGSEIQVDPRLEITRRYRQLMHKMARLATKAAYTPESFECVHKCIIELDNKIPNNNENIVPESSKAPVTESQNIPKGFKKREGTKRKRRWKPWEEKNLMIRRRLIREQKV